MHDVEELKNYVAEDKNYVLLLCLHIFVSNFLPSNIWLLIPSLLVFFTSQLVFFCIFLVW
jgi:hypothetical protein